MAYTEKFQSLADAARAKVEEPVQRSKKLMRGMLVH